VTGLGNISEARDTRVKVSRTEAVSETSMFGSPFWPPQGLETCQESRLRVAPTVRDCINAKYADSVRRLVACKVP